jgi:hypothetical protein
MIMDKRHSIIAFAFLTLIGACRPLSSETGSIKTSREGRAALGSAETFEPGLIESLDQGALKQSWSLQNQTAKELWTDLNQSVKRDKATFVKWQTWYSREDLQRIFRRAFEQLGKDGRRQRMPLSEAQISDAIAFHDIEQYNGKDWDTAYFDRWLKRYIDKEDAIPGLNKVLMNRPALELVLRNYAAIDACLRTLDSLTPCSELALQFPKGAAFLKLAWRRGQTEGDFKVPYYQTDDLLAQFAQPEWLSVVSGIPSLTRPYRMDTPSQQVFHLVGIHLNTRLDSQWLYSSLWFENESLKACTSLDFAGLARPYAEGWERSVAEAEASLGHAWCSNPYLESGLFNHKTNCVGCHQHAGRPWTQKDFTSRLTGDMSELTQDQRLLSVSDHVWSLLNGPEPLASVIFQEIEYFDIYDL